MSEEHELLKHNYEIERKNPKPAPVPPAPAPETIQDIVAAYNETMNQARSHLTAIYLHCVEQGMRGVRFSTGESWSNFQASDRPDIGLARHVDPMVPSIILIE